MRIRLGSALIGLCVLASGLIVASGPANAIGIYRTDGNDTKGPLDLASVRLAEISGGDRFTIKTIAPFTAAQLDGDAGWVEIDIDTNADKKYEFWVAVLYYKGKLWAIQGHGSQTDRYLPVRRIDARTVGFDLSHRYLGRIGSYDFATYSVWRRSPCSNRKPCVDVIPNRYPLMRHDWTPPKVIWGNVPGYSTDVSSTLTFPVSFTARDNRYGSGLDHWRLESRQRGGAWSTVKSGTSSAPTVQVIGEEGANYAFRVLAWDRQKNMSVLSGKNTVVPLDDRNVSLIYSSSSQSTRSGAFLETITQLPTDATLTFTATVASISGSVCILGGPPVTATTTATASISVDGVLFSADNETDSTPARSVLLCAGVPTGTHDVVLQTTSAEPFVVDGLVVF